MTKKLSNTFSRFINPKISKKKYLANLKKIKGVLWTKEDDYNRKLMEEKENMKTLFGGHNLGGIKTKLKRSEIYKGLK